MPWGIDADRKVNGMIWYRPAKAEIDKIESLGNPGWNWDNLEPVRDQDLPDRKAGSHL